MNPFRRIAATVSYGLLTGFLAAFLVAAFGPQPQCGVVGPDGYASLCLENRLIDVVPVLSATIAATVVWIISGRGRGV